MLSITVVTPVALTATVVDNYWAIVGSEIAFSVFGILSLLLGILLLPHTAKKRKKRRSDYLPFAFSFFFFAIIALLLCVSTKTTILIKKQSQTMTITKKSLLFSSSITMPLKDIIGITFKEKVYQPDWEYTVSIYAQSKNKETIALDEEDALYVFQITKDKQNAQLLARFLHVPLQEISVPQQ